MSASVINFKNATLIKTKPNDRIFSNSDRMGTFGPAPNYGSSAQQYLYPTVQSFNDQKEYYFCVKSSAANPNQVIKPSQLVVERDNGSISNVKYDENCNNDTKLYVMYKSHSGFEDSEQPNKEYIITECRAINLETLVSNGRLSAFNVKQADGTDREELIYLCYTNEEAFFLDIDTCGISFLFTIPTAFLAMYLRSRRKIFSDNTYIDDPSRLELR